MQIFNIPASLSAKLADLVQAFNDALQTLLTSNSGSSEPSYHFPGMLWFKSDTGELMIRNQADTGWNTMFVEAGGGVVPNTYIVRHLDNDDFDGIETSFPGLVPSEPDLTGGAVVVMLQTGVGALTYVASSPAAGQFSLSGGTNQDVEFGAAPDVGDEIYVWYLPA